MNKISLSIFLVFCLLFVIHGIYQGIANDTWTSLILAAIVILLGSYSMYKKSRK